MPRTVIWPRKSVLYEINTRIWLNDIQNRLGSNITLADIPDADLDRLKTTGYHAVWLMGIWKTSPYSRRLCANHPGLRAEAERILGDIRPDDLDASVYAVADYNVDSALGGNEALSILRNRLAERDILLVLDFVPNHLAVDHPWVSDHPSRFIHATQELLDKERGGFFQPENSQQWLAHGRDPHFPPWTDTVQLNYFESDVHDAMLGELLRIAEQCDGIRCDMAMLLLPQVFNKVWGWAANGNETADFWKPAISAVKDQHPDFRFMAEVYWGLEGEMQKRGFDYTYDKTLYDHLVYRRTADIHLHLSTKSAYQKKTVRFIENHDEPRAASIFSETQRRLAAALILTLPGMTMIHQGQEYAWQKKLPVQLRRRPDEPEDTDLMHLYEELVQIVRSPVIQEGKWEPLIVETDQRNDVLSYQWLSVHPPESLVFIGNLTNESCEGCVQAIVPGETRDAVSVREILTGRITAEGGSRCIRVAVPFQLAPWGYRLLQLSLTRISHQA